MKTDRLWLASLVRSSRTAPGTDGDGFGQPVDDVEPAAFGHVRDGLDQHPLMLATRLPARWLSPQSDRRSAPADRTNGPQGGRVDSPGMATPAVGEPAAGVDRVVGQALKRNRALWLVPSSSRSVNVPHQPAQAFRVFQV